MPNATVYLIHPAQINGDEVWVVDLTEVNGNDKGIMGTRNGKIVVIPSVNVAMTIMDKEVLDAK